LIKTQNNPPFHEINISHFRQEFLLGLHKGRNFLFILQRNLTWKLSKVRKIEINFDELKKIIKIALIKCKIRNNFRLLDFVVINFIAVSGSKFFQYSLENALFPTTYSSLKVWDSVFLK